MKRETSALDLQRRFVHKKTNDTDYRKVKSNCHYTDKYRGAEHSICNLKYSIP